MNKAFVITSKVLQSVANGIPLSRKEPEYAPFDCMVEVNDEKMKQFFSAISVKFFLFSSYKTSS